MGNNKVGDVNGVLRPHSQNNPDTEAPEHDVPEAEESDSSSQKSKLMVVFIAPVVCMLAMSLAQMSINIEARKVIMADEETIEFFIELEKLVAQLEDERALSVSYFVSNRSNLDAFGELYVYQQNTAILFEQVIQLINSTYPTYDVSVLLSPWEAIRQCDVRSCTWTDEEASEVYDNLVAELISMRDGYTNVPQDSSLYPMWSRYTAVAALARVTDNLSRQQAYVCVVLTLCSMTSQLQQTFESLNGEKDIVLRMMENYYFPSSGALREVADPNNLLYTEQEDIAYTAFYHAETCREQTAYTRFLSVAYARIDFKEIIDSTRSMQNDIIRSIASELSDLKDGFSDAITTYAVLLTLITSSCFGISIWYSSIIQTMISNMQDVANNIGRKTQELESEKKRGEYLLLQMLPRSVVEALARGEQVLPELYPSVTIFFSDIVAFEDISTRSDPHQIVEMLNQLYILFDDTIDHYNAYKVETVRDSYMVVSGLPETNEEHAQEIAHLAMELMVAVRGFEVRHLPDIVMQLRIGIHTGMCVAGIVGLMMPRYCLFGDAVNTASRMQTNSTAGKIHISPDAKSALVERGHFVVEKRGPMEIKGKGTMETWWLVGCKHNLNIDNIDLKTYLNSHAKL